MQHLMLFKEIKQFIICSESVMFNIKGFAILKYPENVILKYNFRLAINSSSNHSGLNAALKSD